jgi:hypothetical protein
MDSKLILKVVAAIAVIAYFVVPKIDSMNDSYEEKFCKSYVQWNKYAWSVRNQNPDNWSSIEKDEYQNLIDIVENESPSDENYITKIATQWFKDSYTGDTASGKTMAAILLGECENYGIDLPEKYLK